MRQRLTARRLVAELGKDAAFRLMQQFGGSQVPHLTRHLRERIERNEAIGRDVDDGEFYSDVGERYGISRQRVAQIVSS